MNAQRKPDDLLTAQDVAAQYGINPRVADSLLRQRGREGKLVYIEGFRRRFIRRGDIDLDRLPQTRAQSSGGTT